MKVRLFLVSIMIGSLTCALLICACGHGDGSGADDETWVEADPVYPEPIELPGAVYAADPCVIRHDGLYYLYPTSTGVDIECWSSADLSTWTYEGIVWERKPCGSWNDGNLWAPHVIEGDGLFYMYYTANLKIGVARAAGPTGPCEEVYDHPFIGAGHGGIQFNAIDACVFRDEDGSLYMYYSAYQPVSVIRGAPMSDYEHISKIHKTIVTPGVLNWELVICEGAWMVKEGGAYYLMYSGNAANFPFYAIGYALSESPMGDFREHPGNPILRTDWDAGFYAPGHHSVVEGPGGGRLMFYHTKDEPNIGWERRIRASEIRFDADANIFVDLSP